jgi:tetratricopeptide (TPR) repeat protein
MRWGGVQAIRLNPKYAAPYYNRGIAWSDKGDLDRAIADYDQAIRLNPKHEHAYVNRGVAWSDKGDLDRAIADYTEAIQLLFSRGVISLMSTRPSKSNGKRD